MNLLRSPRQEGRSLDFIMAWSQNYWLGSVIGLVAAFGPNAVMVVLMGIEPPTRDSVIRTSGGW
jgi:hypothetical protein